MRMATKPATYQDLKSQLDEVLLRLQDETIDIDEAVVLHKTGHELIAKLEKYLEETSAKITKIK
jgi:exodeoxyribonuclease VII small subunit